MPTSELSWLWGICLFLPGCATALSAGTGSERVGPTSVWNVIGRASICVVWSDGYVEQLAPGDGVSYEKDGVALSEVRLLDVQHPRRWLMSRGLHGDIVTQHEGPSAFATEEAERAVLEFRSLHKATEYTLARDLGCRGETARGTYHITYYTRKGMRGRSSTETTTIRY